MTESNRHARFVRAITMLARTQRTEVDALLLEAYAVGLERLPIDKVEAACMIGIQSARFMPTPSDLAEYVGYGPRKSLRKSGRWSCAACGVQLSHPDSLQRGYCSRCWREVGGEDEDAARTAGELYAPDTPGELTGGRKEIEG